LNIAFYCDHPYWGQLGNQGGTRTILLSAQTLRELGHTVSVVAHKDRFTWFKHPHPVWEIPKGADAVIAVTISDVPLVMKEANGRKMAYWARPFETWSMPEDEIVKLLRKFTHAGGRVMCNSSWQVRWLGKHGVDGTVQFAGIAEKEWVHVDEVTADRYIEWGSGTIGCQYSKAPRKQWKRFKELHRELGDDYRWCSFGSSPYSKPWLSHLHNPDRNQLQAMYWQCGYFFCPNKLEGFYNVAAEAALSGCVIVRLDHPRGGMDDYSDSENSIVAGSVKEAAERIRRGDVPSKSCRERVLAIGTRTDNMKKLVELL
jgi:hypothetical protein